MKKFLIAFILLCSFGKNAFCFTPSDTSKRSTVAIFLPLYLDSAFDATNNYRYGKQFPKFLNPGLEFYEGVQLAIDSMRKLNLALDVQVYDTRSNKSIYEITQLPEFGDVDLIIGHTSSTEMKMLAEIALRKKIPFINPNFPNDGNITNNPYFVLLNSTLRTHCMGIYKFLQKNYGTSPVIVFRQKGEQEDRLKGYFDEIAANTASVKLKMKYVNLNEGFTADDLLPYLDSTRQSVCIAGSLGEDFATNLCTQLSTLSKTYPLQVMGMPTWDGMKDLEKYNLDIFYSTPFYNAKVDPVSTSINNYFKTNFYSRPSDMVFRGYETFMHFGLLLNTYGKNIDSNIGDKKFKVFTDFDIQPTILNMQTQQLEYFENHKLYFVKKTAGVVKAVY
jgi:hypothetical protein